MSLPNFINCAAANGKIYFLYSEGCSADNSISYSIYSVEFDEHGDAINPIDKVPFETYDSLESIAESMEVFDTIKTVSDIKIEPSKYGKFKVFVVDQSNDYVYAAVDIAFAAPVMKIGDKYVKHPHFDHLIKKLKLSYDVAV